jgi:hypothetical protein
MDIRNFEPYNTNIYHYLSMVIDKYKDTDYSNGKDDPFEALSNLIRLRHDIIHLFLESILTNTIMDKKSGALEFSLEYILKNVPQYESLFNGVTTGLNNNEIKKAMKKTPDMILVRPNTNIGLPWKSMNSLKIGLGDVQTTEQIRELMATQTIKIVDVSVSTSINKSIAEKKEKYGNIRKILKTMSDNVEIYVIAVSVSLSNLYQVLDNVSSEFGLIFDKQSTYMAISTLIDSLETTIDQLKQQIGDKRAINFFMSRQYGDNEGLSYEGQNLENSQKNNELIEEMYNAHMQKGQGEDRSMIDEMSDDCTQLEDNDIAEIVKKALESNYTDGLFEQKSNSKIITDELTAIEDHIQRTITSNVKPSIHAFSPLTNSTICESMSSLKSKMSEEKLEQRQIFLLLSLFSGLRDCDNDFMTGVGDLCKEFMEPFIGDFSEYNRRMFGDGIVLNDEIDTQFQHEFDNYKTSSRQNKQGTDSKINFIHEHLDKNLTNTFKINNEIVSYSDIKKKIPIEETTRSIKQKMIRLDMRNTNRNIRELLKMNQSGIKVIREKKEYKDESVEPIIVRDVDNYMNYLSRKGELPDSIFSSIQTEKIQQTGDQFLVETMKRFSKTDAEIVNQFKNVNTESSVEILDILRKYPVYWYSFRQFLIAEQLCHFTQFTLPTNTFSLFTAGSPNTCFIVQNSYHDSGKDVGKAFLSFGYTDKVEEINSLFGKVHTIKRDIMGKKYIFFCTNWRRLTATKTTFMRDQYYSTLSTGITSLLRSKEDLKLEHIGKGINHTLRHHFTLKTMVGYATNQRTAELLSDMRYAIMSSFSEFSRIDKFIADKFKPPFRTAFDMWIFSRLYNIRDFVDNIDLHRSNMTFKQPKFVGGKRTEESLGGQVMIPSIWDGYIITELQDILDDLFVYVHTIKEPSSIHYENVKSINTILKFQNMYNNLTDMRKKGDVLNCEADLIDFLCDSNIIGHSTDIVQLSAKHTMRVMNKSVLTDLFQDVLNEPLSNITSTKAAIPEYERKMTTQKVSNKKIKMIRQQLENAKQLENNDIDVDKAMSEILTSDKNSSKVSNVRENEIVWRNSGEKSYTEGEMEILGIRIGENLVRSLDKQVSIIPSDSHLPGGIRAKVHDCLLDFLIRNPDANTVLDLARWNVVENNSLVHADICIKAQYGAKREFYVINIGAKAQARLLEEFFHRICNMIPNEMISVPGDKKLINMQTMMNEVMVKKRSTHSIYYTNGDCTKWSAAETMECFFSLIKGMSSKIPEEAYKLLKVVIRSWGMKKINIPVSILTNTFKIKQGTTEYLSSCTDAQLSSTQNFLQGMFNYMSSFKAVCCSNYTNKIWKLMYPDSDLDMQHLEHSDDYVLMISVRTEDEMLKFRKFHRMMMKLHGFNDSEKKTNTQKLLMEFISLASLNGHMTYPQIKKTKEVGLNLGCTGYRDDTDMAISRVGEAIRIGTPCDAAYAMQKIHIANVYRSYSLYPGQRNNMWDHNTMMEIPVEIFGMPDPHPIFSIFTKGNINNYRLFKFGIKEQQDIIEKLFSMEVVYAEETKKTDEIDIGENLRLYHPSYTFVKDSKLIKKIREKLGIEYEDVDKFWEEHKSYNFIKPVCTKYLMNWMKAMYFRSNFTLAYSRNSRAQVTLRLSTFTSKMCIINTLDSSKKNEILDSNTLTNSKKNFVEYTPVTIQYYNNWLKSTNSDEFIIKCKEILARNTSLDYNTMLDRTLCNCDSTIDALYNMVENSRLVKSDKEKLPTMAMLTPNRLLWVSTDNSPTTLLQYIFNPKDLQDDMRYIKSHKSLEADKESISKYYKVPLDETSPLSTVKTVFQDIIMSQQRRNLCMSYMNIGNNLDDFFKKHIEYGLSTVDNFDLHTRGITSAKNPHTGEQYFKKNIDLTRDEVRLMIDDVALAYVLLKHGYGRTTTDISSALSTYRFMVQTIQDETRDKSLCDMFSYNIHQLMSIGCKNQEILRFIYLKSVLWGDMTDMYKYMETSFSYQYEYIAQSGIKNKMISDQVNFSYMECNFTSMKDQNGNIVLIADKTIKRGLLSAYIISLKLFNKIRMSDLEYMIMNPTRSNIERIRSSVKEGMDSLLRLGILKESNINSAVFLTGKGMEIIPVQDPSLEDYVNIYGEPYIYIGGVEKSGNILKDQSVTKRIEIYEDRSEVRTGASKIFSLPYLDCNQSNLSYVVENYNLNGLSLNWWLNMSRMRTYLQRGEVDIKRLDIVSFGKNLPELSDIQLDIAKSLPFKTARHIPPILRDGTTRDVIDVIAVQDEVKSNIEIIDKDIQSVPENEDATHGDIEVARMKKVPTSVIIKCMEGFMTYNARQPNKFANELDKIFWKRLEQILNNNDSTIEFGDGYKLLAECDFEGTELFRIKAHITEQGDRVTLSTIIESLIKEESLLRAKGQKYLNTMDDCYRVGELLYDEMAEKEHNDIIIWTGAERKSLQEVDDLNMEELISEFVRILKHHNEVGLIVDIVKELLSSLIDYLNIVGVGALLNYEDHLTMLIEKLQVTRRYETETATLHNILPIVVDQVDCVSIEHAMSIGNLGTIMEDKKIVVASTSDLLQLVQERITKQVERGVITESQRSEITKAIYGGVHPMEVSNMMKLIVLQNGMRHDVYMEDIEQDHVIGDILSITELVLKYMQEGNAVSETIHPDEGNKNLMETTYNHDLANDFDEYKRIKDRLDVFGYTYNDFMEDYTIVDMDSVIKKISEQQDDIHEIILQKIVQQYPDLTNFRENAIVNIITRELESGQEFITPSQRKEYVAMSILTLKTMVSTNMLRQNKSITLRGPNGVVDVSDMTILRKILLLPQDDFTARLDNMVNEIKMNMSRRTMFADERAFSSWKVANGEFGLKWDQVKNMTIMEFESKKLSTNIPIGNFALVPLEEEVSTNIFDVELGIGNPNSSESGDSSGSVIDRQITYHQLSMMEPIVQRHSIVFTKQAPYNISNIIEKGNPSNFIMNKYLGSLNSLKQLKPMERISIVQKMKYIINDYSNSTNQDKQMAIIMLKRVLESFDMHSLMLVGDDIIISPDEYGIRLLYIVEGCSDIELKKAMLEDGGKIVGGSVASTDSQDIVIPVDDCDVQSLVKPFRQLSKEASLQPDLSEMEMIFNKCFGKSGDIANRFRQKYGLNYNPV